MATKLHIPAPCHEDWSGMTTVQHDCRHCAVCEKSVVDFTMKTDAEIQEILRQNSGKVCGRFLADQLERPLLATRPTALSRRTGSSWSIAASVAAMLSVHQVAAQQPATPIATEQTPSQARDVSGSVKPYYFPKHDSIRIISGKIIHQKSRKPIVDCAVSLDGASRIRVYTDENGIFSLKIPMEEINGKAFWLRVKLVEYEPQQVKLPARARLEDLAIAPIRYRLKKQKQIVMGCPAFMP